MLRKIHDHVYDFGQWKPNLDTLLKKMEKEQRNPYRDDRYLSSNLVRKRFGEHVANLSNPEIRGSKYNPDSSTTNWHYDGGSGGYILLWANILPTEVRVRNKPQEKVKLKPWHIYAIDNDYYLHRTPPNTVGKGRFFARAYANFEDFKIGD